jgi:predicted transcriptional regulator YdeE
VAGISARVSNDRPQEIGALWQHFYAQGIAAKIPNKKSENIYSVYIDYESDHTGAYTIVIGCEVNDAAALPADLGEDRSSRQLCGDPCEWQAAGRVNRCMEKSLEF